MVGSPNFWEINGISSIKGFFVVRQIKIIREIIWNGGIEKVGLKASTGQHTTIYG